MKVNSAKFLVPPDGSWSLEKAPTAIKPLYKSKSHYRKMLDRQVDELSELQNLLFAHNRYALLLVFQAMDAAGKDSAIKHVMSGVNPQGCEVYSFKGPSATELEHDFLWRTTRCLPQRGRIGIFNRSYYEEVLIVRVHPEILQKQLLPAEEINQKTIWEERYLSINNLENHLFRSGTRILKFFLHLSKEEQRQRFLDRLEEPDKHWKFSSADVAERKLWNQYMDAYENCLQATSTKEAPWFAVPADDKKNARLIIADAIVDALKDMKMSYPKPNAEQRKELEKGRKELAKEKS